MSDLERALLKISPEHAGKINWDAALFHFNQNLDPQEAANRIAATEQPMERR